MNPGSQSPDVPDPRRWRALGVCLVAGFMTLLDVSIVNVALPSIRTGLDASQSDLQWVLSGYALAFGLVLVPSGRLGDVRGRRRVFLAGLGLFTLASAACGLAPSAGWLTAARLAQGVAGGMIVPQSSGFIQELFSGAERGKAFGLLGASIGVSTAVGPLLGGALIAAGGAEHGWRLVFAVNLPVGLAAIPLARRLLPEGGTAGRRESLDPVGVLLLGTGVLLLLLPLVEERSWEGPQKWALVPAALFVLALFTFWERVYARRGQHPMVDLEMFGHRSYTVGSALALLYFAGFTAIFFVFTLFLQAGLGYSALEAGLTLTPFALGSAAAAGLGGRYVVRIGRPLVAGGLALVGAGLITTNLLIGSVDGPDVGWAVALPLLAAGIGGGLVITPNITLSLTEVPVRRAGSAGGVVQTSQRIGSAIGIAVVGAVFFSRLEATRGDWTAAVQAGLLVCTGFVLLALVLALSDVRRGRTLAAAVPPAAGAP
ncbi:MAG: MFS transporter [Actinomycetes bacterium]